MELLFDGPVELPSTDYEESHSGRTFGDTTELNQKNLHRKSFQGARTLSDRGAETFLIKNEYTAHCMSCGGLWPV